MATATVVTGMSKKRLKAPMYRDKILHQDLPVIARAFGFTDMVAFHQFISDLPGESKTIESENI